MKVKLLELRDRGTFIPLVAVDMNPIHDAQVYLLRRCGYPCNGDPNIAIAKADASMDRFNNDPYAWGDRTFSVAHNWIIDHWNELSDGDVVDVEFILGESSAPKRSEREHEY